MVDDGLAHAAVDADEVAWAYPFPDLAQRCEHLRAWREPHASAGRDLLVVAEVIESPAHLADVLAALGADAHLLVCLEAEPATLRDRIVAREPPGWHSLDHLLGEVEPLRVSLAELEGVHLRLDSQQLSPAQISERVRSARPDILGAGAGRA